MAALGLSRMKRTIAAAAILGGSLFGSGGCDNAGQGAISGASIGALSGLALGSLSGNMGSGAAAGAVIGGVTGAVIGDQNEREANRPPRTVRYEKQVVYRAEPDWRERRRTYEHRIDRDRVSLLRFAGEWEIEGWISDRTGERIPVTGWAGGQVDHRYFLVMDFEYRAADDNDFTTGTATLAAEPRRGVTLTARYSSGPSVFRFAGDAGRRGDVFRLEASRFSDNHFGGDPEVTIRFIDDDRWVADVTARRDGRRELVESYTYNRIYD